MKKTSGITLITLVLTIVIMLIILGITINLGIDNLKTKNVSNLYTDLKTLRDSISVYYNQYGTLPLKEKYTGSYEFQAVKNPNDAPEGYYVIDVNKLENMLLVRDLTWTNEDVYIINTKTHTIYYPAGVKLDGEMYYRLPGEYSEIDINSLIITATTIQNETREFKDATGKNRVVVPGGFKVRTDLATTVDKGIVIEDRNGNQFVWVPIGEVTKSDGSVVNIEFGRYSDFSLNASPAQYASEGRWNALVEIKTKYSEVPTYRESLYASKMPDGNATAKELSTFITTTIDNGGYYIARYEASFGSGDKISSVTNGEESAGEKAITNQKPNFKKSTSSSSSSDMATVTSTPGMLWNHIRQGDASLACQNLYAGNEYNNQNYVECDLVNSYAWDTAVMFIQKCSDKTDYANQGLEYGTVCNTGETSDNPCNIYDMAGNLKEWTTEHSSFLDYFSYGRLQCVDRGGSCYSGPGVGASYRTEWEANLTGNDNVGFRAVLSVPYKILTTAKQEKLEITQGTENTFDSLFTVTTKDGTTTGVTKTYTLNGEATEYTNTSELAVGTYTLTCTASYNGVSDSDSMTIVVLESHNIIPVAQVAPTCLNNGKKAYYYCIDCGKNYVDPFGIELIENIETWGILEATGHSTSDWKGDKDGHWKECTTCGVIIEGSEGAHEDTNNDGKCDTCGYVTGLTVPDDDTVLLSGTKTCYTLYDINEPIVIPEGVNIIKIEVAVKYISGEDGDSLLGIRDSDDQPVYWNAGIYYNAEIVSNYYCAYVAVTPGETYYFRSGVSNLVRR